MSHLICIFCAQKTKYQLLLKQNLEIYYIDCYECSRRYCIESTSYHYFIVNPKEPIQAQPEYYEAYEKLIKKPDPFDMPVFGLDSGFKS